MFGSNAPGSPFFTVWTALNIITSQPQTFTFTGPKTWTATAQAGVQESIMAFNVSDDAVAKLYIDNDSASDTFFRPRLRAVGNSNLIALVFQGEATTDSGTNAIFRFNTRTVAGAQVTNRPLMEWANFGTSYLQLIALNGGTDGALAFQTSNGAAPSTGASRSTGTRLVLRPTFNGAGSADIAIGHEGGPFMWFGVDVASSAKGFKWYGGSTEAAKLTSDGAWTYTKAAQASTFETLATWQVSDDTSTLTVTNDSSADGVFRPSLVATQSTTGTALALYGRGTTDTGSNALMTFNAQTATNTAIATRPLFAWNNAGTEQLSIDAKGRINIGVGTTAAFTTSGLAGSRGVIYYAATGGNMVIHPFSSSGNTNLDIYTSTAGTSNMRFRVDSNGMVISGNFRYNTLTVTAAGPTTLSTTDNMVFWNPTVTAAGTINLPAAVNTGQLIIIKDAKGIAGGGGTALTISGNGKTIDGAASITVATNWGVVQLVYNGTEYNVISAS
jgi:hypothetical protein